MSCQISLGPDNSFALQLPSGRRLFIPNTPAATGYLHKILLDAQQPEPRRGYIGSFPTQGVVDAWIAKATVERKEKAKLDLGFDIDELEIDL